MPSPECLAKEGGTITQGGIAYVLRTFPEPSETFIHREIRGLLRVGVPVTVLAMSRVAGTELGDLVDPDASPLRVHYLEPRRRGEPPEARAPLPPGRSGRLIGSILRDLLHLRLHPRRCARAIRLAWRARRAVRCLPAGVRRLHAHFANDAAALARYIAAMTGLPYAVTAHAYDIYQDPYLLVPNLAAADRVHTVSRANLDHLLSMASDAGWQARKISLLRCGIELPAFPYREPGPAAVPARLLCVARLVEKKGHEILLQAVSQMVRGGTPVHLTLAGSGPMHDRLLAMVGELGLEGSVEFLGTVPQIHIPKLMHDSDALVLASRVAEDGDRDGLPVVMVEAAALGLPVVGTEVSGIPELVTEQSGWTSEPDDPAKFAEAIRSSIEASREERIARTRKAREIVEREFDIDRQIETLLRS